MIPQPGDAMTIIVITLLIKYAYIKTVINEENFNLKKKFNSYFITKCYFLLYYITNVYFCYIKCRYKGARHKFLSINFVQHTLISTKLHKLLTFVWHLLCAFKLSWMFTNLLSYYILIIIINVSFTWASYTVPME